MSVHGLPRAVRFPSRRICAAATECSSSIFPVHDEKMPDGTSRYCYLTSDGQPSPNLRLKPGDLLIIHFQNDLTDLAANAPEIDRALAAGPICQPLTTSPVPADESRPVLLCDAMLQL
jgi:hypothetical protein